ncbi:MAG: hypothetical protein ABR585_11655 [Gemmatimonadaceae bacterium]
MRVIAAAGASCLIFTIAYGCTDISGSDTAVLSIQFDTLSVPSVVVGDTLRDSSGAVITPVVRAFNFKGREITSPQIRFQSPDSGIRVDSITGIVTGDSLRSTPARIIATVGGLQAVQRIDVTLRPDSIFSVNAVDSISFSLLDSTVNVSPAVTVKLTHGIAPNDSAVKSYLVSFQIVAQSNPQLGQLVNDAGRPSAVDTTDASGIAGRALRLHPLFLTNSVDSIVVRATAKYRGVTVRGSPVRLVVKFKPRG